MTNPYTPREELRELSFQYCIDSYQLRDQASILLDSPSLEQRCKYHIGYLSKINVLLYMSIECALKSLVCAANLTELPKDIYWNRIRRSSHKIDPLLSNIPTVDSLISDTQLLLEIKRLASSEVSERYCVEVSSESDLMDGFNIDSEKLQDCLSDTRKILEVATRLEAIASNFRTKAFASDRVLQSSCCP